MKYKREKGFTLIELLVVIAIIGILSSVVLSSLNIARGKAANTAVKSNLQGIRSQAEIIYDGNGEDYTDVCADSVVINEIESAILAGGDTGGTVANRCNSTGDAWAANVMLKVAEEANIYWCVDSLGNAKGEAAELNGATVCA